MWQWSQTTHNSNTTCLIWYDSYQDKQCQRKSGTSERYSEVCWKASTSGWSQRRLHGYRRMDGEQRRFSKRLFSGGESKAILPPKLKFRKRTETWRIKMVNYVSHYVISLSLIIHMTLATPADDIAYKYTDLSIPD